jgi:hypothetical protein
MIFIFNHSVMITRQKHQKERTQWETEQSFMVLL